VRESSYALIALRVGILGDAKSVGGCVSELRIDWGPGYRVYYRTVETTVMVLLCGGDKRKQSADIKKARTFWKDYKERTESK
jgi:putative addiction module killer protein